MAVIDTGIDFPRILREHAAERWSATGGIKTAAGTHDDQARRRTTPRALLTLTDRLAPGFRGKRNAAGGGGEQTGLRRGLTLRDRKRIEVARAQSAGSRRRRAA